MVLARRNIEKSSCTGWGWQFILFFNRLSYILSSKMADFYMIFCFQANFLEVFLRAFWRVSIGNRPWQYQQPVFGWNVTSSLKSSCSSQIFVDPLPNIPPCWWFLSVNLSPPVFPAHLKTCLPWFHPAWGGLWTDLLIRKSVKPFDRISSKSPSKDRKIFALTICRFVERGGGMALPSG